MTNQPDAPKRYKNIVIAALSLIGVILLIAFIKPAPPDISLDLAPLTVKEPTISSFDTMTPEDWPGLARAEKNIQSLQKGQVIVEGIIADPTDNRFVYFATSAKDEEDYHLGIYKYNVKDYTFERIYKETRKAPENGIATTEYLAGFADGKLILKRDTIGFTLQNCVELIALTPTNDHGFSALDLANPYGAWESYTPSKKTVEEALARKATCEN